MRASACRAYTQKQRRLAMDSVWLFAAILAFITFLLTSG